MQTSRTMPARGEGPVAPAGSPPAGRWCGPVARAVGTAHMVAGALLVLGLASNAAMGIPYAGGYLGLRSMVSASSFTAAAVLIVSPLGEPNMVAMQRYFGMLNLAVRSPVFYGVMALVDLNLAGLNLAIGYGLRRRQPWARRAHVGLMGPCLLLTALHTAALARVRPWGGLLAVPAAAMFLAALSLVLLTSPTMIAYFRNGQAPGAVPSGRRRPWWWASAQFLLVLLMGADALGILILLTCGPLAEITAACAWLVVSL